jgi:hypothetical protein
VLTFVHAFIVFAAVAATSATSSQLPVVAEGKLASVVLLQAGRASSEDLKACCQGAKGGLKLVFLMRPIDDPIEVTLSPQVETLIDRQPYMADDDGSDGRPKLEVLDVDDLFRRYPDLAARVPQGYKPHLGLIVTIPGTALPESGQVDFSMKLGYHKQLERFSFSFALT